MRLFCNFIDMGDSLPHERIFDYLERFKDDKTYQFYNELNRLFTVRDLADLKEYFLDMYNSISEDNEYFVNKDFEIFCKELVSYYNQIISFIDEHLANISEDFKTEEIYEMKNLISIYDDFCDYVDEELKRYYTYRKNNLLIDKYCEEEKGKNVPYKIALLDEIGIFKLILNPKFKGVNDTQIYKIIEFLTGGSFSNVKKYYNSLYGNYAGDINITDKHKEKAREIYFK